MDRLLGPISGVVASRADPEGRGRITVAIPGVFEGDDSERVSSWAEPVGAGRGVSRGKYEVPEVGAEVVVWPVFDPATGMGHPDVLYYMPSNFGVGDVPEEVLDEDGNADPDIHVEAWRDYVVVVDERDGKSSISIRHRASGDGVQHDATTLTTTVSATGRVVASSATRVEANAPVMLVNGRFVMPGTGPVR